MNIIHEDAQYIHKVNLIYFINFSNNLNYIEYYHAVVIIHNTHFLIPIIRVTFYLMVSG